MIEPSFPNHLSGLSDTLYGEPTWVDSYRDLLESWLQDSDVVISPEMKFIGVSCLLIFTTFQRNHMERIAKEMAEKTEQHKQTVRQQPKQTPTPNNNTKTNNPTQAPEGKITEIETKQFPYY